MDEAADQPDVPGADTVEGEPTRDQLEELRQNRLAEASAMRAPTTPWELVVHQSMTYYQPTGDGGMILKFIPGTQGPNGSFIPLPPAIVTVFSPVGWERFKKEVAADGEKQPEIETSTILPGITRTRTLR